MLFIIISTVFHNQFFSARDRSNGGAPRSGGPCAFAHFAFAFAHYCPEENDSLTEVQNCAKKFFFNYVFVDCNKIVIQVMNGENGSALIITLRTRKC